MIKCPYCQMEHPENTIFCNECGAYLLKSVEKDTNPLAADEMTEVEREETSETIGEEVTVPLGLRLTILDSGRDVEVPLTEEVNIGRLDPGSAIFPDVDLTSNGGLDKGVSRSHAKITRRGNEVSIEDLGSFNGTYLNGKKLAPYLPHVLKDGDELRLGELILQVSFTN